MTYLKWLLTDFFKKPNQINTKLTGNSILEIFQGLLDRRYQHQFIKKIILNDRIVLSDLFRYPPHVIAMFVHLNHQTPLYTPINSPNNSHYYTIIQYWTLKLNFFYKFIFPMKSLLETYKMKIIAFIKIIIFNMKWILLAAIISFMYFFISLFYIQIDFAKQLAVWYVLLTLYYLLMSGFNSFLNKYKYGKFTSAIQRFWKRTGIIFWLLEGFLFILFFYYFLNSSQEPLYMFDYSSLNQELLIQLKVTYKSMILLSLAIYLSFILILNMNFFIYYQNILLLSIISLIVFYTLYIESYQFVYIITLFADKTWLFDESSQSWVLDIEENNLRVKQQYFILCLIAKYWHFIFIFISWFFFLVKSLEANKISITMLGYNVQNLLILYVLNLMCLIQWIKYLTKKFLEITYYWFYIQYDEKFFYTTLNELWLVITNYINIGNELNIITEILILSNTLFTSSDLNLWKFI